MDIKSLVTNNSTSAKKVEFDEWSGGDNNYNKAMNGEKVEDFKMFDFNPSSYSSDLKEFSQEYIEADQDS